MEAVFSYKDLGYFLIYAVSLISFLFAFKYRVAKIEEATNSIKKIIFKPRGGLNIMEEYRCLEHRAGFAKALETSATTAKDSSKEIQILNQNIIKIMVHLEIEPISPDRRLQNGTARP